jgi:hypothetical protein
MAKPKDLTDKNNTLYGFKSGLYTESSPVSFSENRTPGDFLRKTGSLEIISLDRDFYPNPLGNSIHPKGSLLFPPKGQPHNQDLYFRTVSAVSPKFDVS